MFFFIYSFTSPGQKFPSSWTMRYININCHVGSWYYSIWSILEVFILFTTYFQWLSQAFHFCKTILIPFNKPIEAKYVASVINCGLGLATAMAPIVNRGWQPFTNGKYWKSFSKLFHIKRRLRLVFQLNDYVFPTDLTQYWSGYNPMIERTHLSRRMTQLNLRFSCWLVVDF